MSEKRFKVIDDAFSKWIVDTTLKEDKHEGAIYTAYDMACRCGFSAERTQHYSIIMTRFAYVIRKPCRSLRIHGFYGISLFVTIYTAGIAAGCRKYYISTYSLFFAGHGFQQKYRLFILLCFIVIGFDDISFADKLRHILYFSIMQRMLPQFQESIPFIRSQFDYFFCKGVFYRVFPVFFV